MSALPDVSKLDAADASRRLLHGTIAYLVLRWTGRQPLSLRPPCEERQRLRRERHGLREWRR